LALRAVPGDDLARIDVPRACRSEPLAVSADFKVMHHPRARIDPRPKLR
jgi:hypothetical protein